MCFKLVFFTLAFVWIFTREVDTSLRGPESGRTLTVVAALCVEALCIITTYAWFVWLVWISDALIVILDQKQRVINHHLVHHRAFEKHILHVNEHT